MRIRRPEGDARRVLETVRAWPRVVDATVTEAWIGVYFDGPVDLAALPLESLNGATLAKQPARRIELTVRYDGEDLAEVAREAGISEQEVIELHEGGDYEVLFLGFLPGFAYLGGLSERLRVTRRPTPRTRVPKNALAIAGPYTGVYPFASAGGWRLIGTVIDRELFSSEGSLLRPGDRVRFRSVP